MKRFAFLIALMLVCALMISCDCDENDDDDDDVSPSLDDDTNDDDDNNDDDTSVCDCTIDGACYANGETNPNNVCLICDPARSASDWSPNDGAICDDGMFCNGDDACLDGGCDEHEGNPCPDNGLWCDGDEICDEGGDRCLAVDTPDCSDDTLWCNGDEFCDEDNDQCAHTGTPCPDDGVFCNGDEWCEEDQDQCRHTGDPCTMPTPWCNEESNACEDVDCAIAAEASLSECDITLTDLDGVEQDEVGLTTWCGLSEELFTESDAIVAPFWDCWADCIFAGECDADCFDACLYPTDPGFGCAHAAHEIYTCDLTLSFPDAPNYFIPLLDVQASCQEEDPVWECRTWYTSILACSDPPTPEETQLLSDHLYNCVPQPAVALLEEGQNGHVPYHVNMNAQVFTLSFWFQLAATPSEDVILLSRLNETSDEPFGWEVGVYGDIDRLYFTFADTEGDWNTLASYTTIFPEHWYYVVVQYDGDELTVYLDFHFEGDKVFGKTIAYDETGLGIGRAGATDESNKALNGAIDYIDYRDAVVFLSPFYRRQPDATTIGLWEIDEGEGTTLVDLGPFANDGYLSHDSLWIMRDSIWQSMQTIAPNESARHAGQDARLAEELHYANNMTYADNLTDLLTWDQNLTDDPLVTFLFGTCSQTGYTYTTRHTNGDIDYLFTD